jgi:hypothetical protein
MAVTTYTVTSSNDLTNLINNVQKLIDLGWEPIGGVAIKRIEENTERPLDLWHYYQALIKQDKKEEYPKPNPAPNA